jgi:hypothetical protein
MINDNNYVIWISKLARADRIYWNRIYYAKLRRDWTQGSKILFVAKKGSCQEAFIGLGKIEMVFKLSDLDISEKRPSTYNKYHSKIVFGTMVRFFPAVLTKDAQPQSLGKMSGPVLDGAHISDSEISKIQQLANVMIIM